MRANDMARFVICYRELADGKLPQQTVMRLVGKQEGKAAPEVSWLTDQARGIISARTAREILQLIINNKDVDQAARAKAKALAKKLEKEAGEAPGGPDAHDENYKTSYQAGYQSSQQAAG